MNQLREHMPILIRAAACASAPRTLLDDLGKLNPSEFFGIEKKKASKCPETKAPNRFNSCDCDSLGFAVYGAATYHIVMGHLMVVNRPWIR